MKVFYLTGVEVSKVKPVKNGFAFTVKDKTGKKVCKYKSRQKAITERLKIMCK